MKKRFIKGFAAAAAAALGLAEFALQVQRPAQHGALRRSFVEHRIGDHQQHGDDGTRTTDAYARPREGADPALGRGLGPPRSVAGPRGDRLPLPRRRTSPGGGVRGPLPRCTPTGRVQPGRHERARAGRDPPVRRRRVRGARRPLHSTCTMRCTATPWPSPSPDHSPSSALRRRSLATDGRSTATSTTPRCWARACNRRT